MTKLQKKHATRWPDWFADPECGFWLPEIWDEQFWTLCELFEDTLDFHNITVEVSQVKAKYGSLRFYYTFQGDEGDVSSDLQSYLRGMVDMTSRICQEVPNDQT